MKYTGNFLNMTDNHLGVFEQIALNKDGGHPAQIVKSLLNKGYVEAYQETGRDMAGVFSITRYRIPLNYHAEWCDWCAAYDVRNP